MQVFPAYYDTTRRNGKWQMTNERSGTVKWFNVEKGYGFITPDDASDDVFVHHTAIAQSGFRRLEEGQQVEYIASEGDRGLVADTVCPIT